MENNENKNENTENENKNIIYNIKVVHLPPEHKPLTEKERETIIKALNIVIVLVAFFGMIFLGKCLWYYC